MCGIRFLGANRDFLWHPLAINVGFAFTVCCSGMAFYVATSVKAVIQPMPYSFTTELPNSEKVKDWVFLRVSVVD